MTVRKLQVVHNVTMSSSATQATLGASDQHSDPYTRLPLLNTGF